MLLPKPSPLTRRHGSRDEYTVLSREGSDSSSEGSAQELALSHRSRLSSSDSGVQRSERKELRQTKLPVPKGRRHPGPKYPGLTDVRPTNPLYRQVMSYRTYRLDDTTQWRYSRAMGKFRYFRKRMELTLKDHCFSGEDPILVLDLFLRYVRESNLHAMLQSQAFIAYGASLLVSPKLSTRREYS